MSDKGHTIVLDNPMELEPIFGTPYPTPLQESSKGREKRAMGDAVGIVHYGVNLVHIPPGEVSSQRHWHSKQDEFLYMLEGEVSYRHGDHLYALKPGDTLFFDADAPHGPEILQKLPALYLSIISYPQVT